MRNSKLNKMAADDASKWARAEMFFGEGAGTRRKLLEAEIGRKVERISGYNEAFQKYLSKQNWADHAIKAAKERKRLDSTSFIKKNLGALARGDRRSMSNGFAAVVIVGSVAHATGYDKKALTFVKGEYDIAKKKYDRWQRNRTLKSVS